jgi:hypothetical protein
MATFTKYPVVNNKYTKMTNAPGTAGTSINIASAEATGFVNADCPYLATVVTNLTHNTLDETREIVIVTAMSSDTGASVLTVTRAQESTTAIDLAIGDYISFRMTALHLNSIGDQLTGVDVQADSTKLAGIETAATADQTGAEIKALYEAEADTNAFTDAEKTLLGNQSGTNTGDQNAAGVSIADAGGLYTATDVEGALAEVKAIADAGSDDQTASEVPIVDSGALYTATDVEGALAEVKAIADAGTGDVTAGATITDNRVVRGDVGSKGIQESGVTLDDSENMSGVGTLDTTGAITVDIGAYGQTPDANADNLSVQQSSSQVGISIIGTTTGNCNLFFGDSAAPSQGRIIYENSGDTMNFRTAGVERFHVNSTELKTVVESLHDGASAGHTMQSGTGDGTTTIDWGVGNLYKHTFGAQNETFTFTAPTNPGTFILILVQDSVGSRTATWPASVDWPAGTAPTLTTTATTGTDIIHFVYDGTNYYGTSAADFS